MKSLYLLLVLVTTLSVELKAQNFEHFNIKKLDLCCFLYLKPIENRPGIMTPFADEKKHIFMVLKKAFVQLPDTIRQKIVRHDRVIAIFDFDAKGSVFNIRFNLPSPEDLILSEKEWLKVCNIFHSIKIDISELEVLHNTFSLGSYHISLNKFLQVLDDPESK